MISPETEVIQIYEVYIDIYFIENVMMDIPILIFVLLLLREKILLWRLLAASLAGGAGAVLILMSGVGFGIMYIFFVLLLDACMLLICTYRTAECRTSILLRRMAKGIIYLHGMVFAYGKLVECADRLAGERLARIGVTAVITVIVVFLAVCRNFTDQRHIYEVTLTENGEDIAIKALFDTGNLLRDPVSGKPVSVMEENEEIRQWLMKYPHKYKIIPYHSIGNEHGILEGIVVDQLLIHKEQEQVIKKETIVALYKGKLSKNGDFQMILNHNLMSA